MHGTQSSIHYPAYYTATCKNEKYLHTVCLFTIYLLPSAEKLSTKEIVRQRRWRCLATEYAEVDELPDYLHSDTKDVNQSTFLDSGHYMLSNIQLSENNSPPEVGKAHARQQSIPQHWEGPCNKHVFIIWMYVYIHVITSLYVCVYIYVVTSLCVCVYIHVITSLCVCVY